MYNIIVTLHILFAGIWLSNFLMNLTVKLKNENNPSKLALIGFYLKFTNLTGMVASMGILVSGIYMTAVNPAYSFFEFSANHWLVSKQIVMVIILALVFSMIIPNAKVIKKQIVEGNNNLDKAALSKLNKISWTINILVLINILFALSHRLM